MKKLIQELVLGEVNFRILDILMTNEATEIYHSHEDATMIDAISEKGSWPAKCTDIKLRAYFSIHNLICLVKF